MVPIESLNEDLAEVSLTIEDTDEEIDEQNEGNEGGPGWSAMASMCKPSSSQGRREENWGEENQWLNFRSFLGSFPFYRSGLFS